MDKSGELCQRAMRISLRGGVFTIAAPLSLSLPFSSLVFYSLGAERDPFFRESDIC